MTSQSVSIDNYCKHLLGLIKSENAENNKKNNNFIYSLYSTLMSNHKYKNITIDIENSTIRRMSKILNMNSYINEILNDSYNKKSSSNEFTVLDDIVCDFQKEIYELYSEMIYMTRTY